MTIMEVYILGGIPNADIYDLDKYWRVYPNLFNSYADKG